MRLAMSGDTDEDLKFDLQMGATDLVGDNALPTDKGYHRRRPQAPARQGRSSGSEVIGRQRPARRVDLQEALVHENLVLA